MVVIKPVVPPSCPAKPPFLKLSCTCWRTEKKERKKRQPSVRFEPTTSCSTTVLSPLLQSFKLKWQKSKKSWRCFKIFKVCRHRFFCCWGKKLWIVFWQRKWFSILRRVSFLPFICISFFLTFISDCHSKQSSRSSTSSSNSSIFKKIVVPKS